MLFPTHLKNAFNSNVFMSRIAVIDKKKCNPAMCGNYLCKRVCPINRGGAECVFEAPENKAGIREELCIGCNICVVKCPMNAISIINLPEMLKEDPIHRYGENGFALYNLPVPIFGKVVGILGRNGIGKSTAINILSGNLKPNLGTNEEKDIDELISRFKGTEAQGYFEKLKSGEIKVSYKPQMIEIIPKMFQGKVIDLLKKVNETNKLEEISKILDLEKIYENDISKISGGELQRVAIAATVLKKANVYFFDEPTSYLDIKQRIKISKFIRSLADENTAVMVIEHDLIILDYITELVHIVYGKENVYGITGLPKSTKNGINVYLEGYLKEENVRFRDSKIVFEDSPPSDNFNDDQLVEWPAIEKKLGNFKLNAKPGVIHKHDVIGILGENGIGKTSFVKELSQVDAKTNRGKLRISYKPQIIEESDEYDPEKTVMELLMNAMQYDIQLIKPLALKDLYEKKLGELSGGQLQRVMIAAKLAEEADLYLMDEPSAYLDVEQRLIMSNIIKNMMLEKGKACLVVDHDLLFIDYISDKITVFQGIPAVEGHVEGPFVMAQGMNLFLKDLNITFRRDGENHRPRVNKEESIKDREQKSSGDLYYSGI